MLLTQDDIKELTGVSHASKQAEVLERNRIPYILRGDRKIVTTWEAVNGTLCHTQDKQTQPDFSCLETEK